MKWVALGLAAFMVAVVTGRWAARWYRAFRRIS